MKKQNLILFICLFMLPPLSSQVQKNPLKDLEWILGNWERQNASPGQTHLEKWWKESDRYFRGIGFTMAGADTVFVERLGIIAEKDELFYVAEVQANPAPVYFKFIHLEKYSFVCENPEHDVPKKIAYKLEGRKMTAKLSWEDGGFDVVFLKVE